MEYRPTLWIIGGLDPWGASGIALDLRVVAPLPIHPCVLMTRLTVQSLTTYEESQQADNPLFLKQCLSLKRSNPPQAIKLGMLGTESQWDDLLEGLSGLSGPIGHTSAEIPLVFDPIFSTSSGGQIIDASYLVKIKRDLLPMVSLVTPNLLEAEALVGFKIKTTEDIVEASQKILSFGPKAILIKGGHVGVDPDSNQEKGGEGGQEIRGFYRDSHQSFWVVSDRLPYSCRGTGCALSSLIAAELCRGAQMVDSIVAGQWMLDRAYRSAYHAGKTNEGQGVIRFSSETHRGGFSRLLPPPGPDGLAPRVIPHDPVVPKGQLKISFSRSGSERGAAQEACSDRIGFYPIVPSFDWLRRLVGWGVKSIQLRVKDPGELQDQNLDELIGRSVAFARGQGVLLYINDFWKLALKHQAYGVHLGQEDLDAIGHEDLSSLSRAGIRLGISTHSEFELARALDLQPSYVALGPIFKTTCKSMAFGPHGIPQISRWRQMAGLPIVAIGGMKPVHIPEAIACGASGIAVISDVLEHPDPEKRCMEWLEGIRNH